MWLSEVPKEKLLGKTVWNHKKTQQGKVVDILPKDREDISVVIDWENGKRSIVWHFWCYHLEVIG